MSKLKNCGQGGARGRAGDHRDGDPGRGQRAARRAGGGRGGAAGAGAGAGRAGHHHRGQHRQHQVRCGCYRVSFHLIDIDSRQQKFPIVSVAFLSNLFYLLLFSFTIFNILKVLILPCVSPTSADSPCVKIR